MSADDEKTVLVVGAGLCGALAALSFAKRGYTVTLMEGRPDWRVASNAEAHLAEGEDRVNAKSAIKRSINLALSHRGQEGLRSVGLLDEVMKDAIPMRCRAIHSLGANGDPDVFQPYDEVDTSNAIYSVSREGLNNLLITAADKYPNVTVKFGFKLTHITPDGTAHFRDCAANPPTSFPATYNDYAPGDWTCKPRLIMGSDGAYSSTREAMLRLMPMNFKREYITHGYKELCIPPTKDGEFAMSCEEALHIWPRGQFMMIGLPNPDKSFTCTLFAPFDDCPHDDKPGQMVPGMLGIKTEAQIDEYFKTYFPDAIALMPNLQSDFQNNPACRLVAVQARPWNFKDKILLVGDSAHAMVPFYGQGMNAAFEDVLSFFEMHDEMNGDLSKIVPAYAAKRQPAGEAIAQLSMQNYVEMRHHTADPMFRYKKKVEGVLNWLFPNWWVPLYKMVAFTRIPYHESIARAEKQERILSRVFTYTPLALAGLGVALYAKQNPQSALGKLLHL